MAALALHRNKTCMQPINDDVSVNEDYSALDSDPGEYNILPLVSQVSLIKSYPCSHKIWRTQMQLFSNLFQNKH